MVGSLTVLNLEQAKYECIYGRGCDGICCQNGRPPVYPDEEKIIRTERLEELLDDLTFICEQLRAAQDATANGRANAEADRWLRRVK